jgi:hypothetical protein
MSNKGGAGARICERLINQQTLKGGAIPTEHREKAVNLQMWNGSGAQWMLEKGEKVIENECRSVWKAANLKVYKAFH